MSKDPLTILVAEDEESAQFLYREQLSEAGYNVLVVGNGLEALFNLESEKVDLLITDTSMPLMDTYQMISEIKKKYPDLPIMVITGHHDQKEYDDRGLTLQAFYRKPVDMNAVKMTVARLLKDKS